MFWLLSEPEKAAAGAAAHAEEAAEHGGAAAAHHTPPLVEFLNHYFGEPLYRLQVETTKVWWDKLFANFGTDAETVFGPYTPDNAIPWYTVMFVLACILTMVVIWILRGSLSVDEPSGGQQVLETAVLAVRNLLVDVVGPHGIKYFPVVATFAILILISNLMAFLPGLLPPTASTSVTFALGLTSFLYYNWIGIKENGFFGHLRHFAGPVLAIAPLLFIIELISNFIRPFTLGVRLFGNIFADEQVVSNISGLFPPYTFWIIPVFLMPLGLFVAFIQTFIFMFLSIVYISEVSHPPHDEHGGGHGSHGGHEPHGEDVIAPAVT